MLHIEISYSGTERSDALDAHIREAVTHENHRFADRLTRVEAHVSDDNGAKRGKRDKKCVLEARPRSMDPIAVTEEGDDLYAVVREASRKLSRALGHRFDKADAVV
ncbi:MAG: HPF/RaiA family ribosome-associated protein [Phycisphaerales bacterium]|nr:HPF/RaiA family ribosome-associated protein [Phycisphaerales bacterium]